METETITKFGKLNCIKAQPIFEGNDMKTLDVWDTNSKDEFISDAQQVLMLNQKGNRRVWLEAVFTVLTELTTQNISLTKKSYDSKLTEQDLNIDIVYFLKTFGTMTGYFINSTSWREQELKDFDREELKNRLQRLISQL